MMTTMMGGSRTDRQTVRWRSDRCLVSHGEHRRGEGRRADVSSHLAYTASVLHLLPSSLGHPAAASSGRPSLFDTVRPGAVHRWMKGCRRCWHSDFECQRWPDPWLMWSWSAEDISCVWIGQNLFATKTLDLLARVIRMQRTTERWMRAMDGCSLPGDVEKSGWVRVVTLSRGLLTCALLCCTILHYPALYSPRRTSLSWRRTYSMI